MIDPIQCLIRLTRAVSTSGKPFHFEPAGQAPIRMSSRRRDKPLLSQKSEGETPVLEDLTLYNPSNEMNDHHYYVDTATPDASPPRHRHQQQQPNMDEKDLHLDDEDVPIAGDGNAVHHMNNKEFQRQFQGREQSNHTRSVAKIRWFENRKSQILGFCLCLGMLGVTLALYQWRWAGLVSGSVLTLLSGSAVVYTYSRRKRWHQHPNPIVHMRSVLSMFFAVCLLINVIVYYQVKDSTNECRILAGFTEFFVITSEAWGLMMACDLFSSLMSPFANYKRQMKFYHLWVWSLGTGFAIVTLGVNGAAGFFRVDGQKIFSSENSGDLVGFCLASSQQCCAAEDGECSEDFPKCDETNFLNAQQW